MMFSPAVPPTHMTSRISEDGTLGRASSNLLESEVAEQAPLPAPSSQSDLSPPPASSPPLAPSRPVSPPPAVSAPPPSSVPPPPPPINPPPLTPPPHSPPPPVSVSLSPPPPAPTNKPPPSPPPSPPPLNPISPPPPPNNHNQVPSPPNLPPINDPPPPPPLLVSPPPTLVVEPVPRTPNGTPPPPFHISPPHPSAPTTNPPNPTTPMKPPPSPKHPDSSVSTWSPPSDSNGNSGTVTIAVTVGVVFAVALVAFVSIFVLVSRKKRRTNGLGSQYRPASGPFILEADGHYHIKGNTAVNSTNSDTYHPTPSSPSALGQSYASFRTPLNQSGFAYEELMEITNGFLAENIIGQGGFGCVYKGCLPNGRLVAVKQLKPGSGQGEREFKAEVEIISRVHHRHLVSLVGYCISDQKRLLVYEFVPNKTLEYHLHAKGLTAMEWPKRVKIAIGSARGLAYLHEDCHPRIIHRDIKSANILLDQTFEAQVADFGLAKLTNDAHTHVSTRVVGTFGYMAPEYASSGKLTDRSDVFSFGVVLLELITGRKPVDPSRPLGDESLVEWARPLLVRALEVGDYEELVDPRLEGNFVKNEMLRMIEVATACVRHSAPKRPRMVQVLRALDCEADLADLSNGVRFGQSMAYDSGQYSADIERFRRMAFGSEEFSSDYGHSESTFSGGSQHKDTQSYEQLDPGTSRELSSGESKTSHTPVNHTRRVSYSSEGSRQYNGRASP